MTGRSFTKRWMIALLGLVLFGLAFPFILGPLVYATGCGRIGGACGAMALVFGVFLRLPIVIGIGIYLAILAWKRSSAVGLFPWGFAFVLLTYLAASTLLFGFGNFWAARFALGARGNSVLPFLFLLAGLIGLSILRGDCVRGSKKSAKYSTFIIGGLALIALLPNVMDGLTIVPFIGGLFFHLKFLIYTLFGPILRLFRSNLALALLGMFVISLILWARSEKADQASAEGF